MSILKRNSLWLAVGLVGLLVFVGCSAETAPESAADEVHIHEDGEEHLDTEEEGVHGHANMTLALPDLDRANLDGPLKVIATTSLIGDVLGRVGGDAITLTVLLAPGQDPHSYQPAAQDLAAVAQADLIFVNGWDLEESLVSTLTTIAEETPIVPISANITPIELGEHSHDPEEAADPDHPHSNSGVDPHVWMDVRSVEVWANNAAEVLGQLDPRNAKSYRNNATEYGRELQQLHTEINDQVRDLPLSDRILVTNHDALRYFALAYGFEIAGTVIPGASTLAEPSANELAALATMMQERGVCTIFGETTASDQLIQSLAGELSGCESVQVLPLYTGALGAAGSGAETYVDMMRSNVATIMNGLERNGE